jgi:hypothetical protein
MFSIAVPLIHAKGHDRGDEKQDPGNGFQGSPQHCCSFVGGQRFTYMTHGLLQSKKHATWNQWREKIEVTEYAIKCVFHLPSEGGDPLYISDSLVKQALTDVATWLFPNEPELKSVEIHPTKLVDHIVKYRDFGGPALDEDFCTMMFLWF